MKRFITLIAAVFAATMTLSAYEPADPIPSQTETKEYNLSGFSGLDISYTFQVELTRSNRHSVTVECPEFLVPFLQVDVRDGNLRLGVAELPRDIRRRVDTGHYKVRATVSMPELTELRMSGASRVDATGDFSARKTFRARISGATLVSGLSVRAAEADIMNSGASKMYLTGEFERMSATVSGSTSFEVKATVKEARVNLSGAAKVNHTGTVGKLFLEASGASSFTLDGQIADLNISASGASNVHTEKASASIGRIKLSGAASAVVDVRNELSIMLSGASNLRYRSNDRLRISEQSVSRASSISSFK
ncbi:MAG: DUF2807 domain-containing protein [Bacteroidales bacterium]|nr:DUF2807 domain-containing protein [Bacteroidales bacterium]